MREVCRLGEVFSGASKDYALNLRLILNTILAQWEEIVTRYR